jgi:hypothetical protein
MCLIWSSSRIFGTGVGIDLLGLSTGPRYSYVRSRRAAQPWVVPRTERHVVHAHDRQHWHSGRRWPGAGSATSVTVEQRSGRATDRWARLHNRRLSPRRGHAPGPVDEALLDEAGDRARQPNVLRRRWDPIHQDGYPPGHGGTTGRVTQPGPVEIPGSASRPATGMRCRRWSASCAYLEKGRAKGKVIVRL